jgi:broad specificity phosphatase PhoE
MRGRRDFLVFATSTILSFVMPTLVYLIRHGATELSAEDRFSGSSDPPLSEHGQLQARAAAMKLVTSGRSPCASRL